MKGRTILLALAALIVVGVVAAAIIPKGTAQYSPIDSPTDTTTKTAPQSGGTQEVTLSLKNGNYVVTPGKLQAGVPVKMTVDLTTVTGCTTDIVIPSMNVRKRVSPEDNVITFTPLQTGTIKMSCSIGMARGSFEVVAESGQGFAVAPEKQDIPSGGSCGANGGGCGCGMR